MKIHIAIGFLTLFSVFTAQSALAQGSTQHSGKALENGVNSIGHSVAAGGKLVSGTIAIPLKAAGEVGKASGQAGKEMWDNATGTSGDPLPITDETVTAGPPPAKAMQVEGDEI
ncbi:hypothetical protein [Kaarinaea lacus]